MDPSANPEAESSDSSGDCRWRAVLINVIDACTRYDTTPQTLRRLLNDGTLTEWATGRTLRVETDEIDALDVCDLVDNTEWIRLTEYADDERINYKAAYKAMRRGSLESVRIGHEWWIGEPNGLDDDNDRDGQRGFS